MALKITLVLMLWALVILSVLVVHHHWVLRKGYVAQGPPGPPGPPGPQGHKGPMGTSGPPGRNYNDGAP